MTPQTILISGGSDGIGKAAVFALLDDGFSVATFSRDVKRNAKLVSELRKTYDPSRFLVLRGDVSKESDVKRVVRETVKKFARVDVLFNNAGMGYFVEADKVDRARFQTMINTNVVGMALLTKYVIPHMKKQRRGLVINMASISGKTSNPLGEFYSATKFAVIGYSEGLRKELQPFGIKVATLCPGMIHTHFFEAKELARRKELKDPHMPMLDVSDITRIIRLICTQSPASDIHDITIMPFGY